MHIFEKLLYALKNYFQIKFARIVLRNYLQVIPLMVLERQINSQKTWIRTRDTSSGCSLADMDSTKRMERSAKRSDRGVYTIVWSWFTTAIEQRHGHDPVTISLEMLSDVSKRECCRLFEEHRMVFQWIVTESRVRSPRITGVNQALAALLSGRRRCSRWLYAEQWNGESDVRDRFRVLRWNRFAFVAARESYNDSNRQWLVFLYLGVLTLFRICSSIIRVSFGYHLALKNLTEVDAKSNEANAKTRGRKMFQRICLLDQ